MIAVAAITGIVSAGPATTDTAAVHVLNRIAFGPRPGDVERVRAIGIDKYIDEQLHPERIPDHAMAPRLADLETIRLSEQQIVDTVELPTLDARRARKQDAAGGDPNGTPPPRDPMQVKANVLVAELAEQKILRGGGVPFGSPP
ncbi:MAG TPA: DUF1800 family protein, partial [Vicinamibacterales bacterium]|nr:DUF1800 family protein [Vicinamibacterales bacterium]